MIVDCLFQTACFARGDKRNDGSTFVLLSFRLWQKSKPPAMRVVVDWRLKTTFNLTGFKALSFRAEREIFVT
jgi:hypothetical protein